MSEEDVKRKFGFINRVDDVNWPPLSFSKVDVSYVSPSSIRSEVGEVEDIPDDTAYIVASRHTLAFRIRPPRDRESDQGLTRETSALEHSTVANLHHKLFKVNSQTLCCRAIIA